MDTALFSTKVNKLSFNKLPKDIQEKLKELVEVAAEIPIPSRAATITTRKPVPT